HVVERDAGRAVEVAEPVLDLRPHVDHEVHRQSAVRTRGARGRGGCLLFRGHVEAEWGILWMAAGRSRGVVYSSICVYTHIASGRSPHTPVQFSEIPGAPVPHDTQAVRPGRREVQGVRRARAAADPPRARRRRAHGERARAHDGPRAGEPLETPAATARAGVRRAAQARAVRVLPACRPRGARAVRADVRAAGEGDDGATGGAEVGLALRFVSIDTILPSEVRPTQPEAM